MPWLNYKKLMLILFCLIGLSLFGFSQDQKPKINLTAEEQTWLKNHPRVVVGFDSSWAPFEFADTKDRQQGISAEVLKLISEYTGLKFLSVTGKWDDIIDKFKAGEIDLLSAVLFSPKREAYGIYTTPYYIIDNFIFVKQDNKNIQGFDDLFGKTVALPKGYTLTLKVKEEFPKIKIFETKNILDSLLSVINGQADATIESQAIVNYIMQKNSIGGIKGLVQTKLDSSELCMLVRKDLPILKSIIQKALDIVLQKDIIAIKQKFFIHSAEQEKEFVKLSDAEEDWLKKHPVVRFTGDPDWLPYEAFTKEGKYDGIVSEYLKLIEKRLDITFKKIPPKTWVDAVEMAKTGKVDVLSETTDSELKTHLIFTDSYLRNPIVIIMGNQHSYVEDINQIKDRKIAVIKDYGYVSKIFKKYADIKFYEVENIQDGLIKVSTGKVDALLCSMALGSYHIREMGLNNIKTVGKTEFFNDLGLGVRKEYAPLVPILNKAIAGITKQEQQEIADKWIKYKYTEKTDYTLFWLSSGFFLVFVLFALYWTHKIKKVNKKLEDISKQLSKYLAPQIYDMIFSGKHDVRISSKRKKLTIFFSDIVGFTPMTEKLESEELTELLNNYMTEMATIALKHGATIDKYIGDAIVIFFGDPESKGYKEDALACIKMALEMQQKNKEIGDLLVDQGIVNEFKMRIGINTGYCTVGNFGSDDRMDYTIIGGSVNLAQRLESNAPPGGVLISHETYSLIKGQFYCDEKDSIKLKGIYDPVKTYQVIREKNVETMQASASNTNEDN